MTDKDILERLSQLGLRAHVNRLRGAVVVRRKSDHRRPPAAQWWNGALSREQLLRLISDADFRLDYLARDWGAGVDVASTRDPPKPPADLEDHWSDDPDDAPDKPALRRHR